MAVDNTHTKYLHGSDKKAWSNYKDAMKAQTQLDSFFGNLGDIPDLKDGEEFEIPVKKGNRK